MMPSTLILQIFLISSTTGYEFVKIPISPEEAVFQSSAASVYFPQLLRYNPALASQDVDYLHFGSTILWAGIKGGMSSTNKILRKLLFTIYGFNSGNMKRTDTLGNIISDFSLNQLALSATFATKFGENRSLGTSIEVLFQSALEKSSMAISTNLGYFQKLTYIPINIGLSIRHIGFELIKFGRRRANPSAEFILSCSYRTNSLLLAGGMSISRRDLFFDMGGTYSLNRLVSLSLGYSNLGREWNIGRETDFLNGLTFSFKITPKNTAILYSYSPSSALGDVHRVSFTFFP